MIYKIIKEKMGSADDEHATPSGDENNSEESWCDCLKNECGIKEKSKATKH